MIRNRDYRCGDKSGLSRNPFRCPERGQNRPFDIKPTKKNQESNEDY